MKAQIIQSLSQFNQPHLRENALALLNCLGYHSQTLGDIDSVTEFVTTFDENSQLTNDNSLLHDWQQISLLFQLTGEDLREDPQLALFDASQKVNNSIIESYLFVAIALLKPNYTRSELSKITRSINKLFPMPVMIIFQYGELLTLAIINRRLNKRDESKDVLEKITLIKDINIHSPHRAHVEILFDLSLEQLKIRAKKDNKILNNFVQLHQLWQKVLDTSELNKKFFYEISNWYFWALQNVTFPEGVIQDESVRNATNIIRLITRLIFVWFIKEKGLIGDELFNRNYLSNLLKSLADQESTYYKAILQNLFFATLNTEMNMIPPNPPSKGGELDRQKVPFSKGDLGGLNRKFRGKNKGKGQDQHYGISNVYRYEDYFTNCDQFLSLCSNIPFLNGGLFECLDSFNDTGKMPVPQGEKMIRIDGFSDRKDNVLSIPNFLFFAEETKIDLNKHYGTKGKKYDVRGIINVFNRYKFTIDENTPLEEEIALDPELLGKVFENLLAEYNPETESTARKQTGSFYTPREIVNYMVDESLIAYLTNSLESADPPLNSASKEIDPPLNSPSKEIDPPLAPPSKGGELEIENAPLSQGIDPPLAPPSKRGELEREKAPLSKGGWGDQIRLLFSYNETNPFANNDEITNHLINAIDNLKILDPACGSGAFPMGILQKLVFILSKLDPHNEKWKRQQKENAIKPVLNDIKIAQQISYEEAREKAIKELKDKLQQIEDDFNNNEMDYARKLFLIENCIYGVDIQPIAVQIAKLRFFISLIVEQKVNDNLPNRGILPLPNLETKFVCANTLIGIETQLNLRSPEVIAKETQLKLVRQKHFTARTPQTKAKYRQEDQQLREEISQLLKNTGLEVATADTLARWDPYNQNLSADFFDCEWMFGINDGFDIVIGNPPYISALDFKNMYGNDLREKINKNYKSAQGTYDIYIIFFEKGINLLNKQGILTYITPNKFLSAKYGKNLREYIIKNISYKFIVDLSSIQVFKEASVYPIISCLEKKSYDLVTCFLPNYNNLDKLDINEFIKIYFDIKYLKLLPENLWGFLLSKNIELLFKVIKNTEILEKIGFVNATSTASEADSYGKYITNINSKDSLKIINTGTIDPYISLWGIKEMSHASQKFITPFLPLKKALVNTRRINMYKSPKIIFAKMAKSCEAFLDIKGEFASINTNCFYNPSSEISLKFVVGFCNSKLFMFIYKQFFGALKMSGGYYQFQAPQLRIMPILQISLEKQQPIIKLVEEILTIKSKNVKADVTEIEKKIDKIVYELYGLTEEEIKIIEGD